MPVRPSLIPAIKRACLTAREPACQQGEPACQQESLPASKRACLPDSKESLPAIKRACLLTARRACLPAIKRACLPDSKESLPASKRASAMSSCWSPPPRRQRSEEAAAGEVLPEEDRRCVERPGVGSQLASQRAPESDGEEAGLNIDLLIDLIREREPLWNMGDRRHADVIVTRWLWEQVCEQLVDNWEDLDVRAQNQERERIVKRWRSIRHRFKKEFNKDAGPEWIWRTQE
ncbi:uncharacterized protein [Ranitomeya imitator]|uniref:uncharacterized protein n=1 Tax=Ranitomeya imitator TaxID=111125 RepID=UPI0037E8C77E